MKKISLLAIILMFASCENVKEMEETIFIPDPTDPNLPAYSEWGYNSFGAIYERMYFFSTNTIIPCKITLQNDTMTFSLSGSIRSRYTMYGNSDEMTLFFSFPVVSKPMNTFHDLLALHQQWFDLSTPSCVLRIMRNGKIEEITLISGNLYFQRAQLLRINEQENRVILSGTFDLTFIRNLLPEYISKGRFDVGITQLFQL